MNIAIIPARSGSKGLRNKNIKLLKGKPLIAYSIDAAINSQIFDEIHVSTDSKKYADIAKEYGASVPFLRKKSLAADSSSSWDVIRDILKNYNNLGQQFDMITLLQPTSPLRTPKDILDAFDLYNQKDANAVVSVCEVEHSPLWSNVLPNNLSLKGFLSDDIKLLNRQQLPTYYRLNGAIYMIRANYFHDSFDLFAENCYAHIMAKQHSVDIDDEYDFMMAEVLLTAECTKVEFGETY